MLPFQKLFCSLIYILCSYGLNKDSFLDPKHFSENEEVFTLDDTNYIFVNQRVTWDEAEIICSFYPNGSLAMVLNNDTAKFLAIALSETDVELEDLWVGAQRDPQSESFVWSNGQYVMSNFLIDRESDEEQTFQAPVERNCLSFARNYHDEPSFVDLYCNLKRPFICQKPAIKEPGTITHHEWIRIGAYEYAIFYDNKTWKESVKDCFVKYKANLADFRNMQEVKGIGKYLLVGRPSLENAWIGGHFKSKNWYFISQEVAIPNEKDKVTDFPPWFDQNHTTVSEGCLLLDRHIDDGKRLIFLAARCHRPKSFICSRRARENSSSDVDVYRIDDMIYSLYYPPKTWSMAKRNCELHDSTLVEVTYSIINHILYIMGESRKETNHIWIAGKLNPKDRMWYWVNSNTSIEEPNMHVYTGYPPWLDNIKDLSYPCLNMDRENHDKPLFYGINCNEKQSYICWQKAETELCLAFGNDDESNSNKSCKTAS